MRKIVHSHRRIAAISLMSQGAIVLGLLLLMGLCCRSDAPKGDPARTVIYVDGDIAVDRTETYSPKTRSSSEGTELAFRSLKDAAAAALPGQTVYIRGGKYSQTLRPASSGKEKLQIVFEAYLDEKPVITGAKIEPAIDISDRDWIVIRGLTIDKVSRWMYALRSHHNVIQGNHFSGAAGEGHSSKTGLFFQQATHNQIIGNVIEDSNADNLSLVMSDRNLIASNTFRKAYHTLWTIKGGNFNILRDNFFHNEIQKIGEVFDCENVGFDHEFRKFDCTRHNLIERNVFAFTPPSGSSPFAAIQYAGQNGIIRRNIFRDTAGPQLDITLYAEEAKFATGNRIYNNVFCRSQYAGVAIPPAGDFAFFDNVLKNNIFFRSRFVASDVRWDWHVKELNGKPVQMLAGRLDGFFCENNDYFSHGSDEAYLITLGWRSPLVNLQRSVAHVQSKYPLLFRGNMEKDPLFVDELKDDFRLKPASELIDRGTFLTMTSTTGSGTTLPVEDAKYFCDGFGIPGEEGDEIQLQGQTTAVRVLKVDYRKNVIEISHPLAWKQGQGVALEFSGVRPDVGAYEFTSKGEPSSVKSESRP